MSASDQPIIAKFGGNYYREPQCFVPAGYRSGTSTMTGASIILLIGYDKEKEARNNQNIILCLPILLYLPNEPTHDILPENWTGNYIRRIVKDRTNWQGLARSNVVRQFYNRFISEKRKDKNLDVRAQTLIFPMAEDFFDSLDFLRVRICDRLSIVYRYKGETATHLADAYCLHTVIPEDDNTNPERIADEFITPVFISDEDYIYVEPEDTTLGKITLKCPLDCQHTVTSLSVHTDSRFKSRKVTYEGVDIMTFDKVRIEDEPLYRGKEMEYVIKVLNSITTVNIKVGPSIQDYFVEKENKNLHKIITKTYRTKWYSIANIDQPYDQRTSTTQKAIKQSVLVPLPYYNNEIRKMFPIKLTVAQKLDLKPADYILPRV